MIRGFRGGLHLQQNKDSTRRRAIEILPPPEILVIPMLQHSGEPCNPVVEIGEKVKMGQIVGDSDETNSSRIHASVSGEVIAVEKRPHPSGEQVLSVVIRNDDLDTPAENISPYGNRLEDITPEEVCEMARNAGLVGFGGSGFPTDIKIKSALNKKIDFLIINGTECEPYITIDYRIMIEEPDILIGGLKILMRCFRLRYGYIAVEENKPDAIKSIQEYLREEKERRIRIIELKTKYPQGGEKQLIYAATRRQVPTGRLPSDIGCMVFNVETCCALFKAVSLGIPVISKRLTVAGTAVAMPKNIQVRIGTQLSYILEKCGLNEILTRLIMGGPMMGIAQYTTDVPVIKTTSAVLAFDDEPDKLELNPACIRCGRCVEVCPMGLMPYKICAYAEAGKYDECAGFNIEDCIECGSCSYICPGRKHIVQAVKTAKEYSGLKT